MTKENIMTKSEIITGAPPIKINARPLRYIIDKPKPKGKASRLSYKPEGHQRKLLSQHYNRLHILKNKKERGIPLTQEEEILYKQYPFTIEVEKYFPSYHRGLQKICIKMIKYLNYSGMTDTMIAGRLLVSKNTVASWRKGKRNMPNDKCTAIKGLIDEAEKMIPLPIMA